MSRRRTNSTAPSRRNTFITMVYVADGFADDCEEFIHRCTKDGGKLTYAAFVKIWHEMNFSSLYKGRTCGAEIAELSEEVIRIAKHYMIADTSNFEENVCGLFLVYALLNLQPYSQFACLRLIPEDMDAINHIGAMARKDKRLDVLYILGSVLVKGPVQYHADNRERGMEITLRKYLDGGCMTIDRLGVRPKGVFYRQNPVLDTLRDLKNAYKKYDNAKALIKSLDEKLTYVNSNEAEMLEKTHKQLINGITAPTHHAEESEDNQDDHSENVRAIKQKAMKNVVGKIKHRTGIADRVINKPSSPAKPDIRSKPGKTKSNSPKKALTTNRKSPKTQEKPQARREQIKTEPSSPRKKKYFSSSESESDVSIKFDDDSDFDEDDSDRDLSLDEYIEKLRAKERKEQNKAINEEVQPILDKTQQLSMHFDTLPIYIHNTDGKDIEIEIIDNLNINNESGVNKKAQATVVTIPDVRIDKTSDWSVQNESQLPMLSNSNESINDDHVFKKPSPVKQSVRTRSVISKTNNADKNAKLSPDKGTDRVNRSRSRDKVSCVTNKTENSPNKVSGETNITKHSPSTEAVIKTCKKKANTHKSNDTNEIKDTSDKASDTDSNSSNTNNANINEDNSRNSINKETNIDREKPSNIKDTERNTEVLSPDNLSDVDPVKTFVNSRGKSKRVLWHKQHPEFEKRRLRKSSFNLNTDTLSCVDSVTTTFPSDETSNDESNTDDSESLQTSHDEDDTTYLTETNNTKIGSQKRVSVINFAHKQIEKTRKDKNTKTSQLNANNMPDLDSVLDNTNQSSDDSNIEISLSYINIEQCSGRNTRRRSSSATKCEEITKTNKLNSPKPSSSKNNNKTSIYNKDPIKIDKNTKDTNKNSPKTKTNKTDAQNPDLNKSNCDISVKRRRNSTTLQKAKLNNSKDSANTSSDESPRNKKIKPSTPSSSTNTVNIGRVTRSKSSPEQLDINVSHEQLSLNLKKIEKRQQKQKHRRSKFKKMGIIEIADLDMKN